MFGGANLFGGISKSIEQFKRGVNDFLATVETFNETMKTLNGVATRVSALLDEIEEPVRAFMPQMTRSIKAADAMITQISGPIEKVAPGISRLAETLGSPVFTSMPNDIAGFLDTLGDVARRLQPLAQMAENAGSMFGLRPLSALRSGSGRPPQIAAPPPPPPPPPPDAKKAPATKSPAKKSPAKKAPAKKTATKRR
jgi:hypothetical protein